MNSDIRIKTEKCNFKMRVSGIIIKDGKLLVDSDDSGFLCLPGGYVELNETTEKAILRELKEEICLNFRIDKYLGVAENYYVNKYSKKVHEISFYYLVQPLNEISNRDFDVCENGERSIIKHNFKWINISTINEYNIKPQFLKEILQRKKIAFNHIINDE